MATLVDLNSEPAVEELSRQILSEAKLWEAIQEARMELLRRRNQQVLLHLYNLWEEHISSVHATQRSIVLSESVLIVGINELIRFGFDLEKGSSSQNTSAPRS